MRRCGAQWVVAPIFRRIPQSVVRRHGAVDAGRKKSGCVGQHACGVIPGMGFCREGGYNLANSLIHSGNIFSNLMHTLLPALCCFALLVTGCAKTDPASPVLPSSAATAPAAGAPAATAPIPVAAGATTLPVAPLTVAPEDRLEPASIGDARLPNGAALSVDVPAATKGKKTPP